MVRATAFMENFASVMAPNLEHGEIVLRLPLPEDVALKMTSVRDIGRVAAALLLGTAEAPGGTVELVGDELTGPQIAAASGARRAPGTVRGPPLSVLPNDLDRATFRQVAKETAHPSDLTVVRSIEPATHLVRSQWPSDEQGCVLRAARDRPEERPTRGLLRVQPRRARRGAGDRPSPSPHSERRP